MQENQLAGAKDDHSLVLEQEECADCQQNNNEASNLLLHPNSIAVADRGKASKDALDESLCGDPLMYATFVAPVHQYSTETEPSRQVSPVGLNLILYLDFGLHYSFTSGVLGVSKESKMHKKFEFVRVMTR